MSSPGRLALGLLLATAIGCERTPQRASDAGAEASVDDSCPGASVDADEGACRWPLVTPSTNGCAATWAEQSAFGCRTGSVVFVSSDDAPAGQLVWLERPYLSGGTSCFYDPASRRLVGAWYVNDQAVFCCRTSYDVTYGSFDPAAHEAAVQASKPWVGNAYDMAATVPVEGGEVRVCVTSG